MSNKSFLLISICLCQLGFAFVSSEYTFTDIYFNCSSLYFGPRTDIQLSEKEPNALNAVVDLIKLPPFTIALKVACFTKDENGEYTVDSGVKFVAPLLRLRIPIMKDALKQMGFNLLLPRTGLFQLDNIKLETKFLPHLPNNEYMVRVYYLPYSTAPDFTNILYSEMKFFVD